MNRRDGGRMSYPNDDYSRYAGPDYREQDIYPDDNFSMGEIDPGRQRSLDRIRSTQGHHLRQPGVSGKDRHEGSWFNESQYQTQKNFTGKGPKGYRRGDARIHEEVCEILKSSPYVDASDIEVEVKEGEVILRGTVSSKAVKREAERIIEDIHGVNDVRNELRLLKNQEATQGLIKEQTRH